jgi:hypothetical protein
MKFWATTNQQSSTTTADQANELEQNGTQDDQAHRTRQEKRKIYTFSIKY